MPFPQRLIYRFLRPRPVAVLILNDRTHRSKGAALISEWKHRLWFSNRVIETREGLTNHRKFHRGLINRWKIKRRGGKKKLFQTGLRSIKSLPGFVLTVQRLKLFSPTFLGRLPDRDRDRSLASAQPRFESFSWKSGLDCTDSSDPIRASPPPPSLSSRICLTRISQSKVVYRSRTTTTKPSNTHLSSRQIKGEKYRDSLRENLKLTYFWLRIEILSQWNPSHPSQIEWDSRTQWFFNYEFTSSNSLNINYLQYMERDNDSSQ